MKLLPSDPDTADRVLIDIGREAFKHARELLRAAHLILDDGIWSVAYANAALALEEIGKAVLCTAVLPMPDEQRQTELDAFPARFTDHDVKAFCAFLILHLVEGDPGDWEGGVKRAVRDTKRTSKNKFRGLYVDYKNTGQLLKPSDITHPQASDLIGTVERVLALSADSEEALANMVAHLPVLRRIRSALAEQGMTEEALAELIPVAVAVGRDELAIEEAFQGTALGALVTEIAAENEARLAASGSE
ncbi:AbiV family abortive infection protein [Streptomyces sp. NPDC085460]|uniref:AbiV family abortive infection protein n=1 Tax=Streptomyces sp. NPDC085460 TaxID=3365723 RepID=UPI0037D931CA